MRRVKCLLLIVSLFMPVAPALAQAPASRDAEVSKRAAALLAKMTLEEKIGQLNQIFYFTQLMRPGMMTFPVASMMRFALSEPNVPAAPTAAILSP